MNNIYVADTMAIVLFLEDRKLPANIKSIFNDAIDGRSSIHFAIISLMEIGYLSERGRIDISMQDVLNFIDNNKRFSILNLDANILNIAFTINDIPELHDRLIAASAVSIEAALITNDPLIQLSKSLNTIW